MTIKRTIQPLGIIELLELYGFDKASPTKLVRHQDRRCDVNDLICRDLFDFYQATQGRPVFNHCERIISFIGTEETKARFIGVFRVLRQTKGRPLLPPKGFPTNLGKYRYYYDLEKELGYEDLENRVIIDWGKGTRSWVQKLRNKEVIEILPSGQTFPPFSDYLDFTLTHSKLKELYKHRDVNREWRSRLTAVAGIYLILATTTGKQYVGAAYGTEGIWGRWKTYAKNGHGGNKKLKALVKNNSAYPDSFSYSILQTLPKNFTKNDVQKYEQRYMIKLGSCATGLNI